MVIPAARVVVPEADVRWILRRVGEALETGQLTLGEHGRRFEEEFAASLGIGHAVAVGSGTAALEIILRALGVSGREVIVPTNTFVATATAVLHAGGIVRFSDVNPSTMCLDAEGILANLTARTAAVIVVHIGGMLPPDLVRMQAMCAERNIPLVEDAAHAHGSSLAGRRAGTFGMAAAFSFYPTKVMTSAEGGMVVTNDAALAGEARILRDQGKAGFTANVHTRLGHNWRMSELHAIVGRAQLRRLDEMVAGRREAALTYDRLLEGRPGLTRVVPQRKVFRNGYKYPVLLEAGMDRVAVKRRLREQWGVQLSGEVYELPCHQQPVFSGLNQARRFPVAEDVCRRQICLPVSPAMSTAEVETVVEALTRVMADREADRAVQGGSLRCSLS